MYIIACTFTVCIEYGSVKWYQRNPDNIIFVLHLFFTTLFEYEMLFDYLIQYKNVLNKYLRMWFKVKTHRHEIIAYI